MDFPARASSPRPSAVSRRVRDLIVAALVLGQTIPAWAVTGGKEPAQPGPVKPGSAAYRAYAKEASIDINWAEADRLKSTQVGEYYEDVNVAVANAKFFADILRSFELGRSVGLYEDPLGFRRWLKTHRQTLLRPDIRGQFDKLSTQQITSILYSSFTATTKGKDAFAEMLRNAERHGFWDSALGSWLIYVGAAFGGSVVVMTINGPGADIMRIVLSTITGPVIQAVSRLNSKYAKPKMTWWQRMLSGNDSAARNDADLLIAFPGSTAEEFRRYSEELWPAMFESEVARVGAMTDDARNARNTAFDLMFHQLGGVPAEIMLAETGLRTSEMHFILKLKPQLGDRVRDPEIEAYSALVDDLQETRSFNPLDKRGIAERMAKLEAVEKDWGKRGIDAELVKRLRQHFQTEHYLRWRPAFLLALLIDVERFFPDNNSALNSSLLKNAKYILARQEMTKALNGYYFQLDTYKEKIERYFKAVGTHFDVAKRIEAAGVPYGMTKKDYTEYLEKKGRDVPGLTPAEKCKETLKPAASAKKAANG